MGRRWIRHGVALFWMIGLWSWPGASGAAGWTVDDLAQRYATPDALVRFLQEEFAFTRDADLFDQADYWQRPEEFLARRAGDCEDYALLAQAVLHRQGVEALVLSLYGPGGYAHTVCVFVEGGAYHVINQDRLLLLQAPSLDAVATTLLPGWTWGGIAQQTGTRGRLIQMIHHTSA